MSVDALPVLDVSTFRGNPDDAFVTRLRAAAHGPGFCYLVGHGIDASLEARLLSAAREFFHLPEPERHAIAIGQSPHFRGYTILGDEHTAGARDWRDQIDIGPEEPAVTLQPSDPPWLRLKGPNQWPAKVPQLRDTVQPWLAEMQSLALNIMRALALALGQRADYFGPVLQPSP